MDLLAKPLLDVDGLRVNALGELELDGDSDREAPPLADALVVARLEAEPRVEALPDAEAVQLLYTEKGGQRARWAAAIDAFSGTITTAPVLGLPQAQPPPLFVPGTKRRVRTKTPPLVPPSAPQKQSNWSTRDVPPPLS